MVERSKLRHSNGHLLGRLHKHVTRPDVRHSQPNSLELRSCIVFNVYSNFSAQKHSVKPVFTHHLSSQLDVESTCINSKSKIMVTFCLCLIVQPNFQLGPYGRLLIIQSRLSRRDRNSQTECKPPASITALTDTEWTRVGIHHVTSLLVDPADVTRIHVKV